MKLVEIRRLANVRRFQFPLVNAARAARNVVPKRILFCEVAVERPVRVRIESLTHESVDLFSGGPDVLQVNLLPVPARANRIPCQIQIDTAGNREGNHERWTHQKISFDTLMHPRFKVSIA